MLKRLETSASSQLEDPADKSVRKYQRQIRKSGHRKTPATEICFSRLEHWERSVVGWEGECKIMMMPMTRRRATRANIQFINDFTKSHHSIYRLPECLAKTYDLKSIRNPLCRAVVSNSVQPKHKEFVQQKEIVVIMVMKWMIMLLAKPLVVCHMLAS